MGMLELNGTARQDGRAVPPQDAELAAWLRDQLAEPSEALFRLLALTARDLRRAVRESFRDSGLTGPQFGVLLGAAENQSIGEIAEIMFTDATSVGRLVERMESRGLVARYRIPPDRRVVWVRLTGEGERLLRETLPRHVGLTQELLSVLSERQRTVMQASLTKLRAQVDASSVRSGSGL
ncbi:MAG: MarR family winged helix-turn-helix transcriptional regulator [Dehalococcoidia bacterium]